jgi:hypothetical protein
MHHFQRRRRLPPISFHLSINLFLCISKNGSLSQKLSIVIIVFNRFDYVVYFSFLNIKIFVNCVKLISSQRNNIYHRVYCKMCPLCKIKEREREMLAVDCILFQAFENVNTTLRAIGCSCMCRRTPMCSKPLFKSK